MIVNDKILERLNFLITKRQKELYKRLSPKKREVIDRFIGVTKDYDAFKLKLKREDRVCDIRNIKKDKRRGI